MSKPLLIILHNQLVQIRASRTFTKSYKKMRENERRRDSLKRESERETLRVGPLRLAENMHPKTTLT